MATIREEILIDIASDTVWDAVRDIGALHTRLVPGFVTDTKMEEGARLVTFASGMVLRERIVDCDDASRRLVWSINEAPFAHHNGAMEVFADGSGTRVVWTADLLPHELKASIAELMSQGLAIMKRTLEAVG